MQTLKVVEQCVQCGYSYVYMYVNIHSIQKIALNVFKAHNFISYFS